MKRVITKIVRAVYAAIPILLPFERRLLKGAKDKVHVPIFIVGMPRSGTTLLYQMMTTHISTCFFSNFSTLFYKSPVIISRWTKNKIQKRKEKSFDSSYGYISGIWAPSEAGAIMRHWFRKISPDQKSTAIIKTSCQRMAAIFNAPFINKNVYHNYRIEQLHQIFPNALFINVQRELVYNIRSIYLGIKNGRMNLSSIALSDKDSLVGVDVSQIASQVIQQKETLDNYFDSRVFNSLTISYEELCSEPKKVLEKIISTYNTICSGKLGCNLDVNGFPNIVCKNDNSLSDDLNDSIKKAILEKDTY